MSPLSVFLWTALSAGPVVAQHELLKVDGDDPDDRVGFAVAGTANGWVWIGGPADEIPGLTQNTGAVHVRSWSRAGGILFPVGLIPLGGGNVGAQFGFSLSAGSTSTQVVIGEPGATLPPGANTGRVVVAPTVPGSPFAGPYASEQAGWSVAYVGDVDGDGHPDYVAGAPNVALNCWNQGWYGRVHWFSANPAVTASPVLTLTGPGWCNPYAAGWEGWGKCVSRVGDVDGNGRDDFLIGAEAASVVHIKGIDPTTNPPSVYHIRTITGLSGFGHSLCALGDVNGDTVPDFAVGSPSAREVRVIDSANGNVIRSWVGIAAAGEFGAGVARVSDHDGDGKPELLIGAPAAESNLGRAYVFSVGTGDLLAVMRGSLPGGRFGQAVSVVADLTGDGRDELVIGAPDASPTDMNTGLPVTRAGRAVVFSLDDALPYAARFGNGCVPAGASPPEPWIGMTNGRPKLGEAFAFSMTRAKPGTLNILAVGFTPSPPVNLGAWVPQLAGCYLYVGLDSSPGGTCATETTSTAIGQGFAEVRFTIPTMPQFLGVNMEAQWYDSNNAFNLFFPGTTTRALRVTIGPPL